MPGARSNRRRLCLAVLLVAAPLCAAAAELTADHAAALRTGAFLWQTEGATGQIRIVIDRGQQRAFVYRGDLLIGVSTVSTGKKGHTTPLGTFTILQKAARHRSNKYSNAPMPFMQRLTWDGIALHAGPLPGFPASHGCIRLPWAFAQKLFKETSLGVVVDVVDGGSPLPRVQMVDAAPGASPTAPQLALDVPATIDEIAAARPSVARPQPVAVAAAVAVPVPRPAPIVRPPAAPPVVLALAEPPRAPAPVRPRRASWLEQSADDFVTWGTTVPTRSGSAGGR